MFHPLVHLLSHFCQYPISPGRTGQSMERHKSKSTQPRFAGRWATLYTYTQSAENLTLSNVSVFWTVDIKFLSEGSKTQAKVVAATSCKARLLYLEKRFCKLSSESSTVVQRAPSSSALRFFWDVLGIFPNASSADTYCQFLRCIELQNILSDGAR